MPVREGAARAAAVAPRRRHRDASGSTTSTSRPPTGAASPSSAFPTTARRRSPITRSRCSTRSCAASWSSTGRSAEGSGIREGAGPLRTLAGLRVGIVGLGRIGGAVATRLLALGCEVWANDVLPVAREGVRFVALDELLADCDAVTVHVPLTRETRGLIGRAEIATMRPGAYLVNTSRGAVRRRRRRARRAPVGPARRGGARRAAAGAAACTRRSRRNLVVTPHAAYYSEEAEALSYRLCVARVREVLDGP